MTQNGLVLGVDAGSTKVLAGYVDSAGRILASERSAMNRNSFQTTLDSIYGAIDGFLSAHADQFLAAGIGLVGRCDPFSGRWVQAINLPINKPVEIAAEIRSRFGVEAWIDNDVFCAAQAEIFFGAGKKYKDFLLLNVGTGLSAGIVTEGRLLRGAGNAAGEIGQWRFPAGGNAQSFTLEELCSGGGMIERARELAQQENSVLAALPEKDLHSLSIYHAARKGDALSRRIIDDALHGLCEAVSCLIAACNPAAVVLAGSVACTPGFLEAIQSYVHANGYPSSLLDLREICLSTLDAQTVGLIGAAQVAWNGLETKNGENKNA